MATEYADGTIGESKPFTEALGEFLEACEAGTARAFHVGPEAEIEAQREKITLQSRIDTLEEKVKELVFLKGGGLIERPTPQEIKKISESLGLKFGRQK